MADEFDRAIADIQSGKYSASPPEAASGLPDIHDGWSWDGDALLVMGVAALVLAGFVFDSNLKVRPAFQIRKRYNLVIACGFWFLVFRAVFDFWTAFSSNGALQFLLAMVPAVCCFAALIEKQRPKFLPLAGIYLLLLGVANTIFLLTLAFSGHDFVEGMSFLASLPLRVLPSIFITKALPIGLGAYFLLYWRGQKAAILP